MLETERQIKPIVESKIIKIRMEIHKVKSKKMKYKTNNYCFFDKIIKFINFQH